MGFTGAAAARWKEAYINAFNQLEQRVVEQAREALEAPAASALPAPLPMVVSLPGPGRWLVFADGPPYTFGTSIYNIQDRALINVLDFMALSRDLATMAAACAELQKRLLLAQGEASAEVVQQPLRVELSVPAPFEPRGAR